MHGPQITEADRVKQLGPLKWGLEAALRRIADLLPTQGPIKDFIHHNTLHAFQDHPFHEALGIAANLFGANRYLPLSWYQHSYRDGKITESALLRVARWFGIDDTDFASWKTQLLAPGHKHEKPPGLVQRGMRTGRMRREGIDIDALVHPLIFRLLSSYLDQGISIWRMPHARDSFWIAVRRLVEESRLPIPPLSDPYCRKLLQGTCDDAIVECLKELVGSESLYETYLLEMCLSHPGWSGMVVVLEESPSSLITPRPIRLREMLAIELVCELGWLRRRPSSKLRLACDYAESANVMGGGAHNSERSAENEVTRLWHEALEWTLYENALSLLEQYGGKGDPTPSEPRFQAFFCIDDRECSIRRHLEAIEPAVETFATAGFFGVDFLFQPASSAHAFQFCPIVLKPKHVVREVAIGTKEPPKPSLQDLLHLSPTSNTLFRGWLLTQTLGIVSLLKLAANILRPSSKLLADRSLTRVESPTRLELLREGDDRTQSGHFAGYSFDEMADRVYGVLISAGAGQKLSKLLVFIAHGSSSANNPHFAAYDCGACSGKPGAPNARAFAWMANHTEVRKRLKTRGVELSSETYVVGAIHDTARDQVTYFDLDLLPASHQELFEDFRRKMETALDRNALERCRHFELAPHPLTEKTARAHMENRARSIFEPRPELNHARNALCIVGRRNLTRGLFFDRRAFLNSYDPTRDPSGNILEGILAAVVPVCGGINLEYYFSRVDNSVYGAGSKLSHNVVSLLGVANGVEGDLLTGLPSQMIEVHDPVRLLIIIEQEPELVLDVIKRRPGIYQWIDKDWVKLACFSPSSRRTYLFDRGEMTLIEELPRDIAGADFSPVAGRKADA